MEKLDELLTAAERLGASDIHLIEGSAPVLRVSRTCINLPDNLRLEVLNNWEDIKKRIYQLSAGTSTYGPASVHYVQEQEFTRTQVSAEWNHWRLRIAAYKTNNREAFAIRFQQKEIPDISRLGLLPDLLDTLRDTSPGLILISGGACAGKTTTLHSIIKWLKNTQPYHIRTLEAPIEFIHTSGKSLITQQNIGPGLDCPTYYEAVEDALVQDVNVLAFGEIKDLECLKAALKAANLNLLVIATIHAPSLGWTLARAIDEFPETDRREATLSLARCIKTVIHQKLVIARSATIAPATLSHQVTIGPKLTYRAATFCKENNLRLFIAPEKVLDIDEKYQYKPLETGLFEHPEFARQ